MTLVKVTEGVPFGAKCLDGSPVAYYIRKNPASPDWVVYFKGGMDHVSSRFSSRFYLLQDLI